MNMAESFQNLAEFCKALGKPQSKIKKVLMPSWWVKTNRKIIGYSEGVDTHCCSFEPAWYVWVPAYDYDGYFRKKDLKVVK
jgi:hypothetical protein